MPHQCSIVEVTVVQKLNQGERKKSAVYPRLNDAVGQVFFLDFSLLLSLYQDKESKQQV